MIPFWSGKAYFRLDVMARPATSTASRYGAASKAHMIAIVDDDEAVRVATRHLVRALGFETETFASAEEFLRSCSASEWSCVISDVNMPGLSGIELQRRLASEGRLVPFIFITAFHDQATQDRALKAGAVGFLSKPFASHELIACLERAMQGGTGSDHH